MDKDRIEKQRKVLMETLQKSINPRSELHEIFKLRIKHIMVSGMVEWCDFVNSNQDQTEANYLGVYEEWVTGYIESCFVSGE